jgi:hypothetical protein
MMKLLSQLLYYFVFGIVCLAIVLGIFSLALASMAGAIGVVFGILIGAVCTTLWWKRTLKYRGL